MVSKKFWSDWIFPIMVFFMFSTMLATVLMQISALPLGTLIAYSASPLAYSLMLVGMFIASRPRFIEKHVGMPRMYEIHAVMTLYAAVLVLLHIIVMWQGFDNIFRSPATIFGYLGALGIVVGMLTGMLSLSGIFVNKNKTLRNWKDNVFNREVMLWVHRIAALVAVIGTYLQNIYIPFLRNNTPYMVLLTLYTVGVLGYFAFWKIKIFAAPKYTVSKIYKATPTLWILEFEPKNGKLQHYNPGDYFFIRFKTGDISREAHPFSASSAITKSYSNSIEFMIKEAGDWTSSLKNIKVGDIVTLEGPYGDFYPDHSRSADHPYVLMGGGIGLTPNLSILRSEIDKASQRRIHLIWALSWKEDRFILDELDEYKKMNPNFDYHIIFSNEEVEGFPYGFISHPFLIEINVTNIYNEAEFFICGPDVMMTATKNVLLENGVPEENIRVDEFGF